MAVDATPSPGRLSKSAGFFPPRTVEKMTSSPLEFITDWILSNIAESSGLEVRSVLLRRPILADLSPNHIYFFPDSSSSMPCIDEDLEEGL